LLVRLDFRCPHEFDVTAHRPKGGFFFRLHKHLEIGIYVGLIAGFGHQKRIDPPARRDEIHVAAYCGLGGVEIAKVVDAVDDPKVFVADGEVQDFLIRRKHDERGELNLGPNGNDVRLRIR